MIYYSCDFSLWSCQSYKSTSIIIPYFTVLNLYFSSLRVYLGPSPSRRWLIRNVDFFFLIFFFFQYWKFIKLAIRELWHGSALFTFQEMGSETSGPDHYNIIFILVPTVYNLWNNRFQISAQLIMNLKNWFELKGALFYQ